MTRETALGRTGSSAGASAAGKTPLATLLADMADATPR